MQEIISWDFQLPVLLFLKHKLSQMFDFHPKLFLRSSIHSLFSQSAVFRWFILLAVIITASKFGEVMIDTFGVKEK